MRWSERTHWLFDMDGTLTVAVHDFAAFKASQGLPLDQPILEALDAMDPAAAAPIHVALRDWETEIARHSAPAVGAHDLLERLRRADRPLGVLTRNTREIAVETLRAAGLLDFFDHEAIAGRDCAAHKPSPDGVLRQLRLWGAPASGAVMVGDYIFDVYAGRAAGTATILIDHHGGYGVVPEADAIVGGLPEILDLLT